MPKNVLILIILVTFVYAKNSSVRTIRLRDEGTFNIPASNGLANGNLKIYSLLSGSVSKKFIKEISVLGGSVGIGGIIKLDMNTSFVDFNSLGTSALHLILTTPNNDKLRFLGFALSGDIYLSSSVDTIGENANSTKPVFNPYPLFSLITDLDWIAQKRQVPLKTYLMFSLCDNPEILFEYREFMLALGIEWKSIKNSIFVEAKYAHYTGRYKNNLSKVAKRESYFGFYPGGRYRLGEKISLSGTIGFNITNNIFENSSADPGFLSASIRLDFPLFFKESDAEAVRDMIFMDKKKNLFKKKESQKKLNGIDPKELLGTEEDHILDDENQNKELIDKRKKVEDRMKEIEELLNEEK